MWETLSFFCPWVLLTFSKHRPVPRVTPATQEAPTCLLTQHSAIQYCCRASWDMFFFWSSLHNLLTGTPENSLCRWTFVFLNVYSLSFSCTLWLQNSEPLRAFQPLRVIFRFRILHMGSHLVFLWIFVDCFPEVEQCLVFPSFTVTNFKIAHTDTNLLPFMIKTAFKEAGFPVVLSTLWVTPQPIRYVKNFSGV